jgi:hypothetical protein
MRFRRFESVIVGLGWVELKAMLKAGFRIQVGSVELEALLQVD